MRAPRRFTGIRRVRDANANGIGRTFFESPTPGLLYSPPVRDRGTVEFAGIKVRALLLARGWKEGDLLDEQRLRKNGVSPGFFLKYTNRLVHGKERAAPDDRKIALLAERLGIPVRLLSDDSAWPGNGSRFGLGDAEVRTMEWLRSLYGWYIDHTGHEAAHKYLGLDFDVLRRQTQILQSLARTFGDEALIRVFVLSDYEEGRFDREFTAIERLSERSRGVRQRILAYVQDVPAPERIPDRRFLPLRSGPREIEVAFEADLPAGRGDVRYRGVTQKGRRRVLIRPGMTDERFAFILAREAALQIGAEHGMVPSGMYEDHHWPCEIESYARRKAEVMINRFAAAILLPRAMLRPHEASILRNFSHETVEAACREFGCAPETLLLRIVQLNPREAHFLRVDTPGPSGPYSLPKLFRGNGLPLQHRYQASGSLPASWGVVKSLERFFLSDPRRASAASRHVQLTRFPRCGGPTYLCMSLTYPRFHGGAKALCLGFPCDAFRKRYGGIPRLSEKRVAVDDASYDVGWDELLRLEKESRHRRE